MRSDIFKRFIVFVYYLALLVVLVSWNSTTPPPLSLRMGYLFLLCLPVFFYSRSIFPFILIVFCSVSKLSPFPTYMPTEPYMYVLYISFVLFLSLSYLPKKRMKFPTELLLLIIYTAIIDLVTSGGVTNISYCILAIFLLSLFFGDTNNTMIQQLPYGFAIASLVLSIIFLTSMSQFTRLVDASQDMERVEWMDPNYFGFVIGMGIFCAIDILFQRRIISFSVKILLLVTIVLSILVLVLNASRSAIFSMVIVALLLLLFSKVSIVYKVLATLFGVCIFYYLYSKGHMELLSYRIAQGAGDGGGGRIAIWGQKMNSYLSEDNIFGLIFGIGYRNGYQLASVNGRGFHNDFIAFLVDYGIVGLILFVLPLLKLLKKSLRTSISFFCSWLYLVLCGMTIEPYTLGFLAYYFFYLYVLMKFQDDKNNGINLLNEKTFE